MTFSKESAEKNPRHEDPAENNDISLTANINLCATQLTSGQLL